MLAFDDNNKINKAMFFKVFLVIIVTLFILFGVIFLNGKTIISNSDAVNQHIQVFAKFHDYLVRFFKDPSTFGTWDWNLSNGTDWYSAFSYYILGDPLGYLMIFFNKSHTILGYQTIILIRYVLAGLVVTYCANKFGIKNKWLYLIVVTYLCSLFGIYGLINQSLFLNALIYFPLLIVGVEKFFSTKKNVLLIISIALAIGTNFYWGLILAQLTGMYAIITYLYNYKNQFWIKDWLSLIGIVLLGIGISSVVLLPMILYLLTSPRNGSGMQQLLTLYPLDYYFKMIALPFGMMGISQPSSYWLQGSASAINTFGFYWIIINYKKNKMAMTLLVVMIMMLLFPISAVLLTVGNVATNRWMFVYYLLTSFFGVSLLMQKNSLSINQKKYLLYLILAGIICYLIVDMVNLVNASQKIGYFIGLFLIAIYVFLPKSYGQKYAHIIFPLITVFTVLGQLYLPINKDNRLRLLSQKEVLSTIYQPTKLENKFDNSSFSRTEFANGSKTELKLPFINSFLTNAHATGLYLSTVNPEMIDFSSDLAIISGRTVNPLRNLDNRFLLTNFFGVSQIIASKNSKVTNLPDLEKTFGNDNFNFYKNKNAFPIIWSTKKVYSEKQFNNENPVVKENLLGNGNLAIKSSKKRIGTTLLEKIKINNELENNRRFNIKYSNSKIKFKIPSNTPMGEWLLYLDDVKFNYKSANNRKINFNKNDAFKINAQIDNRKVTFEQTSMASGAFYQPRKNGVMNFGFLKKQPKYITLTFNKPGIYQFKTKLYVQKYNDKISKNINEIKENGLKNVELSYNGLTAMVKADKNQWIGSNIPYSKGWQATLNGKKLPIQRVNKNFVGFKVDDNESGKLKLKYVTPGLKIGIMISIISILIMSYLCCIQRVKKDFKID